MHRPRTLLCSDIDYSVKLFFLESTVLFIQSALACNFLICQPEQFRKLVDSVRQILKDPMYFLEAAIFVLQVLQRDERTADDLSYIVGNPVEPFLISSQKRQGALYRTMMEPWQNDCYLNDSGPSLLLSLSKSCPINILYYSCAAGN